MGLKTHLANRNIEQSKTKNKETAVALWTFMRAPTAYTGTKDNSKKTIKQGPLHYKHATEQSGIFLQANRQPYLLRCTIKTKVPLLRSESKHTLKHMHSCEGLSKQ